MASLPTIFRLFLARAGGSRYTRVSIVTKAELCQFAVRVGLAGVRALLSLKSAVATGVRRFSVFSRPLGRLMLGGVVIPFYQLGYSLRRRFGHWYRPAKNKVMFMLTNRYALHVAMVCIVAATGIVNLQMTSVRAETIDAFNKSLLYSIITQQETPYIEEFATNAVASSSYVDTGLAGSGTTDTREVVLGSSSFTGGGSLAVPLMTSSAASTAPRDTIETYVVEAGDTISTIAAAYGVSINTLLWANNLSVRSVLKPGATLTILPTSGVLHTVKSGDTVSKIAVKYGVSQDEIVNYNVLDADGALSIGAKLVVPGGEMQAPAPVSRPTSVISIFSAPPTTSNAPASTGARMLWPTDGHYIVRGLSWYHTGVDIDCDGHNNGTSTNDNYAAADGVVQYAGWKGGYGITVEINHGNGLVTRYGHFYSLYVASGQTVTTGTPLGRCGSTGNSSGTHLHFEVVGNGRFKNPLEYIR